MSTLLLATYRFMLIVFRYHSEPKLLIPIKELYWEGGGGGEGWMACGIKYSDAGHKKWQVAMFSVLHSIV